eukprot:3156050-Pleurochrysis_carterae.AAC.2
MIQRDSMRHRQRSVILVVHIVLHRASAVLQMSVEKQSDGQGRAAGRWPRSVHAVSRSRARATCCRCRKSLAPVSSFFGTFSDMLF